MEWIQDKKTLKGQDHEYLVGCLLSLASGQGLLT